MSEQPIMQPREAATTLQQEDRYNLHPSSDNVTPVSEYCFGKEEGGLQGNDIRSLATEADEAAESALHQYVQEGISDIERLRVEIGEVGNNLEAFRRSASEYPQ